MATTGVNFRVTSFGYTRRYCCSSGFMRRQNFGIILRSTLQDYSIFMWQVTRRRVTCRFQEISACLHFVDNASVGENSISYSDKLAKFRISLDLFNVACQGMFDPGRYVALDEAMVKCKSKFAGMKVRMPMKPMRNGIKIWCLCSQEGYVYTFEVYTGDNPVPTTLEILGSTGDMVVRLVSNLPGTGYIVVVDNYFTTVRLFRHLSASDVMKMNAVGTARSNRLPKLIRRAKKDLAVGEFETASTADGLLTANVGRDKGLVCLLFVVVPRPQCTGGRS
jgi:hypothetical protein